MSSLFTVPELAIGVGLSEAASVAFEPKLEVPKQTAWAQNPQRLPDVGLIAALVAGGKVTQQDGRDMAARLGFDQGPFDSLTWLAQNRLDFPILLRMWRLAAVNPNFDAATLATLLDRTLAHEQLDWDYRQYLLALKDAELPGIGDIAYAVVRGYLPTDIPLPVAPPSTSTNVKRFPQSSTKAETLAAALGYDPAMLELMIARSGLSMAPGLAAQARFRKILADDDYHLAIAEGDLRTEWADSLLEVSRAIPSNLDFTEGHLRGWLTEQQMYDGTARHGTSVDDTKLMYEIRRRPLSPHQIKQALARGGTFDTTQAPFADPYTASVHEANLGPEWYDLAVHLAGAYPSLFQVNRLVTGGTIDGATGALWMQKAGMADEVVTALEQSWGGTASAATDAHVKKAETQLWTTTHRSYVAEEIDDATATAALTTAGVAAGSIPAVLAIWQQERALVRKQLTPAQIRKAVSGAVTNPATGVAWTQADAIAALLARGYDQADAETFLAE